MDIASSTRFILNDNLDRCDRIIVDTDPNRRNDMILELSYDESFNLLKHYKFGQLNIDLKDEDKFYIIDKIYSIKEECKALTQHEVEAFNVIDKIKLAAYFKGDI